MNSSKIIISVEGNIGVGKSSFIELLKSNFNQDAIYISEPVDEWLSIKDGKDGNGKNLLETFYEDKKRWGYTFQNIAYITRMNRVIDAINSSDKKYIILDRSLDADLNTFCKMLHDEGSISDLEWNAYNLWNTFYYKHFGSKIPHYVIYLRCEPQTAYDRIHNIRCRDEEKGIPLDYLISLHHYHDRWLMSNESKDKTLILDADQEFVHNTKYFKILMSKLYDFVQKM